MPWYLTSSGRLICTGPCSLGKEPGHVPCPTNHAEQPFNDVDTDDGTPFYRCDTCEWIRPDLYGENKFDTAGMIVCPECENGERNDTYDGPCEWGCRKRGTGAAYRSFPDDVTAWLRKNRHYGLVDMWACPKCWHKKSTQILAEYAEHLANVQYHRDNADRLVGTCDMCRRPDYLAIGEPGGDLFICVRCHPKWLAANTPQQVDPAPAQQPAAGWYPDPEHPEDYLRWWSGSNWEGAPTLPEHVITP